MKPIPERALFAKFYENDRKKKIATCPDFTNARQDWRMPLILQRKGEPQTFLWFQLLRWSFGLTSVHSWPIFPHPPVLSFSPKIGKIQFDEQVNIP